jgi:nucleotide-binding universal stress UspA family protein
MYTHLLVPIDGSPTAERGLQEALALAVDQKARVTMLHVIDDYPVTVEMAAIVNYQEIIDAMQRSGQEVLGKAKAAADASGLQSQTVQRQVTQRRVGEVIVEEAAKQGCDLIVMGTHGRRGFSHFAWGSDAEHVVRRAPVPVLLVRHEADSTQPV